MCNVCNFPQSPLFSLSDICHGKPGSETFPGTWELKFKSADVLDVHTGKFRKLGKF